MKLFQNRIHPCFGFHLSGLVPKLPFVEFIFVIIGCGFLAGEIFRQWEELMKDKNENHYDYYYRILFWASYGMFLVIIGFLGILLRRACLSRNPRLLRLWIPSSIVTVIILISLMYAGSIKFNLLRRSIHILSIGNVYVVLKFYLCYVVYYYLKEMEVDIEMSSSLRALTNAEILDFENGIQYDQKEQLHLKSSDNLVDRILFERYNREDFEIPNHRLRFDEGSPLGQGNYGVVYKAILTGKLPEKKLMVVAVKMTKPDAVDVTCFKALLTELKVMTYLGCHPNVVNLIGATTSLIQQRNLGMVVEFCAFGNMETFLRASRSSFVNMVDDQGRLSRHPKSSENGDLRTEMEPSLVSTTDLINWSQEIALGMEYLQSMKVIHGDLAARNVLLTDQRVAKITDFGLARQLYQYSVYVKRQNAPLPWKWLALESLTDMNFSPKSDVWSYGITLWELFTLAESPYQGYNFSFQFVEELKNGLRPTSPQFAPTEIFNLMEDCWQAEGRFRPSFADISEILKCQLSDQNDTQETSL